ncbi:AP-5 complex subunit mu-1-like isoform X2 [Ostrea edulis]|uniref:AP-5 complex subunit mu-1-like isoform X2 n=2 Tax=Ostrea edulis TaxID=37623 RepID=UPI0020952834|nr:AP-5 complex subunit mu-1-like isoform X2 [Ostrea edulis]
MVYMNKHVNTDNSSVINQFLTPSGNRCSAYIYMKTRQFPLVEKKARSSNGEDYISLPNPTEFSNALLFELGYRDEEKFIQKRDTCQRVDRKPVLEVATSLGTIWPVVVVEQRGLLLCCLPLVPENSSTRPDLIQIPGVSIGFSLLCGLADFLRQCPPTEVSQKSGDLHLYLNTSVPFGRISDVNCDTVMAKMYNRPSYLPKSRKQPSWKPVLHKGKNTLYLALTEHIRAVQFNKENVPDTFDLYGTVSCKSDLEVALSDITINLAYTSQESATPLDNLLIHPCVQSADCSMLQKGETKAAPRRIRFTPPTEMFTLCHYTAADIKELPIKAVYDMKMTDNKVSLTIHLTLSDRVKNAFEYCEMQIPFHNRGVIASQDSSVSQGSTIVSPDKKILVWNIGQKFSKSLTAALEATVVFTDTRSSGTLDDPFCKDQNAYAKLFFKIPDFTHSGCCIDSKSIQVSPSTKFKLNTVHEYMSGEYKVWNGNGDVLSSSVPTTLLEQPADL